MTEGEFRYITKRCENIREEVMKIPEKDYFLMAMGCTIENWCKGFGYDPGEVAMEICQVIHMKEKEK